MKTAMILAGAAAATASPLAASEYEFLFTKWTAQHQKTYAQGEFFNRFRVFKANLDFVMESNKANNTYTLEMNKFGDLTWDEFKATYMGYNHVDQPYARSLREAELSEDAPMADIDWTTQGAVTPVKDQGQCGSCWAFSSTGSLEGAWKLAGNDLVSFSEQQLVDCAGSQGNQGCNGGLMDNAFEYWIKNGGACDEASYPYTHRNGRCQTTCTKIGGPKSYQDIRSGDENGVGTALAKGPVSIAIEADQQSFQFYRGGVMDGTCGHNLDHGVLIVGTGSDGGKDYWKVKNSWGASWGEHGYIRLIKGRNQCGLAAAASYPVV